MRAAISRAELVSFVRTLGVDPGQVCRIDIEPAQVAVTTYRRDEHGDRYVEPGTGEAATETTVIPIVGGGDETTVRMRHPKLGREVVVPATAAGHHAVAGWEVVDTEPEQPEQPEQAPADEEPKSTPRGRRKKQQGE